MGKTPGRFELLSAMVQALNSRKRKEEACFQLSALTAAKFNQPKEPVSEV